MWNFNSFSKRVALISEDGEKVLYSDLQSITEKISSLVEKPALVFSMCTNSIGSVAGYVSFMEGNIVPVLLNAHVETELYENLLSIYRPNYIWRPVEENPSDDVVFSAYGYELVKNSSDKHDINPELALMLTTSGSTGSPKFVRQSRDNVRINAEQIVEYLGITSEEKPITTLPMNYTYGLSIINSHLMAGATILLTDKGLMQREFWQFFKDEGATSFGGVPYTYEMLDKLRFMRMELPTLRYMTQAGGKLSPELHKKFAEYAEEKGKKFIVMYGQCEATARMAYLPAEDSLRKYGFMGVAIPGGKFELIDADGNVITEPNVSGELVYYGPNVTLGYAEKPEDLSLGDERNGRLDTGDMAIVDEEGYYKIVGRKKRFLKVYGNRVNLDELDGLIRTQYGNVNVVSAGYDDHVMVFVSKDERSINSDDIKKYLSEKTGLNPAAFKSVEIDSIPRNDSGKVLYRELEKYYEL